MIDKKKIFKSTFRKLINILDQKVDKEKKIIRKYVHSLQEKIKNTKQLIFLVFIFTLIILPTKPVHSDDRAHNLTEEEIDLFYYEKVVPYLHRREGTKEQQLRVMVEILDLKEVDALPYLINIATDKSADNTLRMRAIIVCSRFGDTLAIYPFTLILKDRSDLTALRSTVAKGLGMIGDSRANDLLFERFIDETEYRSVRYNCMLSLTKMNDRKGIRDKIKDRFLELLDSEDEIVVAYSAFALGKIGDIYTIFPIIELLGSRDPFIGRYIELAIAMFGPEGLPFYKRIAEYTKDPYIKINISNIMARMRLPETIYYLENFFNNSESYKVKKTALIAISKIETDDRLQIIFNATADPDAKIRLWAVRILGSIGKGKRSITRLENMILYENETPEVKQECFRSINRIQEEIEMF